MTFMSPAKAKLPRARISVKCLHQMSNLHACAFFTCSFLAESWKAALAGGYNCIEKEKNPCYEITRLFLFCAPVYASVRPLTQRHL